MTKKGGINMLTIALTGGPCSGKSTAKEYIVRALESDGYKVLFCPETATELIPNGIAPGKDIPIDVYQRLVLKKQLNKEELYQEAAKFFDKDKLIIVFDRGICDGMAYTNRENFENLLKEEGLTFASVYDRYDAVIHLTTTAKGALEYYNWNDGSGNDDGNAARSESPEEAIALDEKTLNSWVGHPHLRVFDNSTDFEEKMRRVVAEVRALLGVPSPYEIERKFLIKMPTKAEMRRLGFVAKKNIIQTYLGKRGNTERRIRQRGTKENGYSFFYTEKTNISKGTRKEVEEKISLARYAELMTDSDTSLYQISKTRHCFVFDNRYFEMDIYPFSKEYAILEIELDNIDEEINLPKLRVVKEVTDDPAYSNAELAKNPKL